MDLSERKDICIVVWNPPAVTINDLAIYAALLAGLHRDVAIPYMSSELYQDGSNIAIPAPPIVTSLHLGSPLVTELLAGSPNEWGIVALGLVGFLLKNPDRLGAFLNRIGEAWYQSKSDKRIAKSEYVILEESLRKLGKKSPFDVQGHPIRRFERVYHSREQRIEHERTSQRYRRTRRHR